jgi:DNA-binding transcriptional LysR family regulator
MAIRLHHCSLTWARVPGHPCASVRGALDHANVDYVLVKHPLYPRSKRTALIELTGQDRLPVIQFEDGTVLREESKDLVERIRTGRLYEGQSVGT